MCLVGSVSRELCLNSVWSESMKYRASLPPFFLDHVFDDFGMVLGSIVGSFSSHFGHKNEPAQNNETRFFAAIYCTSGRSQIPKTMLFLNVFTFVWLPFSRHCFGAHISAILVIFGVPWRLYWGLLANFLGYFSGLRKRGSPGNLGVAALWYLGSPGGAQRGHLAKAKWLFS